jgi:hypothetical protein
MHVAFYLIVNAQGKVTVSEEMNRRLNWLIKTSEIKVLRD